ncbi:MAG: hypothetical protein IJZ90_02495, partial [Clostridia bacterium]|nr:hypothetical protein [Clostridia bacterium]
MADIRIITGRAGSGKSSYCIKAITEYIQNREDKVGGAPAFFIVPEQLSVSAERRLLAESGLCGLLRDEVLSFRRAAFRVLGRQGGLKHEMLTQSGKIMLLTKAIRDVSDSLMFYGMYASKPKGMESLLMLIEEFGRYGVTPEDLKVLSEKSASDMLLKAKLHDMSVICEAYRNLFTKNYYDGEALYNDMIANLGNDEEFRGAHVFIDGFNGFTFQEFEIIRVLFEICAEVNISVCTDISGGHIFESANETCRRLEEIARQTGNGFKY